jgi:hypothetical protein
MFSLFFNDNIVLVLDREREGTDFAEIVSQQV